MSQTDHERILEFYTRLRSGEIAQLVSSTPIQYRWADGNIEFRFLDQWPDVWEAWQVDQVNWKYCCAIATTNYQLMTWFLPKPQTEPPKRQVRTIEL